MLLYSTILDINEKMTEESFVNLIIEWNQTHKYDENKISGLEWHGEENIKFGDDKLSLEILKFIDKNIIAVRYEKIAEDGAIWDTDYIMNFDEMRMAVRLDRSYIGEGVVTNAKFSSPHFITLLEEQGYIKNDHDFEYSDKPLLITEDNASVVRDIIDRKVEYQVPVVYVSKTFANEDPVDMVLLCKRLRGVAHVLLQEDNKTTNTIRELCQGKNVYNGSVEVYYPNDLLGTKKCALKDGNGNKLLERVVSFVLKYSILQREEKLYTWQGVVNSLLDVRLAAQRTKRLNAENERDKAKNEVEDVYSSFDEELETYKRMVDELTRENVILRNENLILRAEQAEHDGKPVLCQGIEHDMYPGEIKDIILSELKSANIMEGSRRKCVIDDIIEANNYEGLADKRKEKVKNIFNASEGVDSKFISSMEELGFVMTKDGGHYKLRYKDESRFLVTISGTPGDKRTGKNTASDMILEML